MNISKQRGLTLIGFIIVLAVAAFFMVMGAKLFPGYSEFSSVKTSMDEMAKEPKAMNYTVTDAWNSMDRRFNISYVTTPTRACLTLDKKMGANLTCAYEYRTGFIYNIDFVMKFTYTVKLGGAPG
jgi:Tfp pilus assembly major pilin PilA